MGSDISEGLARIVFVGEFDRSVDGNGRLALPATFRDELGSRCYVTAHPDGYVAITTEEHFRRKAEELMESVRAGERPASARRDFGRSSVVVGVDKQSRITLDDATRRHAGIRPGGQAVLVGALDELQVWRPSRLATVVAEHGAVEPARTWDDDEPAGEANDE